MGPIENCKANFDFLKRFGAAFGLFIPFLRNVIAGEMRFALQTPVLKMRSVNRFWTLLVTSLQFERGC